ncbi:MAG: hypothetical protein CR217_15985 [Beijerinckiaceae bacterium]|nr:MAG: hypothetical protein CR217_15985 [Beijerinckiaceae bacterium]
MITEKAPSAEGAFSEMSPAGCYLDNSENRPPRQNTQIKFQAPAPAEFDAEIALALTASGWRVAASLLAHAAKCIEAGDLQSAERNRRQAREQFVAATDVFWLFQEARAAEGASILGEAL